MMATVETALNWLFAISVVGLCVLGLSFVWIVGVYLARVRAGRAAEAAMRATKLPADEALPAVLVQLPVYNELAHVAQAIRHASTLDWPRDKLRVQIIDQSDDGTTEIARAEAAKLTAEGIDVRVLRRDSRVGAKAGALAAGLRETDEPFVAVFDVDYTPDPAFLKDCMRPLLHDERVGFVQARCDYANWDANWLTRGQIMMLDAHLAVEQPGRHWVGHPIQFDGSAGIWRRETIEAVGGWDGDTLSEDLDLGTRAQLNGWRGVYLFDRSVAGELPEDAASWRKQQARWSSGFAQTMRRMLPRIWRGSWPLAWKIGASFQISLPLFYPLILIAAASGLALQITEPPPWPVNWVLFGVSMVVLLVVIVGMTLPGHLLLRKGGLRSYVARVPVLPFLYFYLALANIRQVMTGMLGGKLAFEKTPKAGETR